MLENTFSNVCSSVICQMVPFVIKNVLFVFILVKAKMCCICKNVTYLYKKVKSVCKNVRMLHLHIHIGHLYVRI